MNNFMLKAECFDTDDDHTKLRIRTDGTIEEDAIPQLVYGILNCILHDDPEVEQFIAKGLCLYVEERKKEHGINKK